MTNVEVRRKIQAAIGEYDELLTLVKKRKLRCFSHVSMSSGLAKTIYHTEHSERKKKKSQTEQEVGSQHQRVDRKTLPAQLGQLKTEQDGRGLLRIHLWCHGDLPRFGIEYNRIDMK